MKPQPQGESLRESPPAERPVAESAGASGSDFSFAQKSVKRRPHSQARNSRADLNVAQVAEAANPVIAPAENELQGGEQRSASPAAGVARMPRDEAKAIPFEHILSLPLSASMRRVIDEGRQLAETERFRGFFGTGLLLLSLEQFGRSAPNEDAFYAPRFLADQINRRAGGQFTAARERFYEQNRLPAGAPAEKPDWFSRNLKAVFDAALALPRHDGIIAARHVVVALLSLAQQGAAHPAVSAWEILANAGVDRRELLVAFLESLANHGPNAEREEWRSLLDRQRQPGQRLAPSGEKPPPLPRGPLIPGYGADSPSGLAADDCLDLDATVDAMANLIASPELDGTISLGVFGHWGSGKSFFMRRLRGAIDELTKRARLEQSAQSAPVYWPNVAQVEFNAWHYVDANLWASLMSHLLDVLRRWAPDEGKGTDATGLGRAIEKLEITSAARDHAVRRENAAKTAKAVAEVELKSAQRQLEATQKRLGEVLARSLWSFVETKLGAEREKAAAILHELGLLGETAGNSVQPIFAQLRELTSTAGRMHVVVHQLLRSADSGRELRRLGLMAGVPLSALLVVSLTPWGEWLRNAGAVLATTLASALVAAAQAAGWIQKHAVIVMDKLAPLMAIRSKIELELSGAESERATLVAGIEQELAACNARVVAAAAEVATRDKEVREAMQAVADAVSGRAVRQFIEQRLATGDYQKHLGLIATIRRDFEQLSDLIRAHNATRLQLPAQVDDIQRALRRARPDITPAELRDFFTNIGINRVVLYIDDLDRCPSNRVVEVLQAIHLLLSFPIFVVVVGVDSRWMAHSLAREYPALLTRVQPDDAAAPGWSRESRLSVVTTSDYLEKIFQIPFWIPPLTAGAAQKMIGKLVAITVAAAPAAALGQGDGKARPDQRPPEPATGGAVTGEPKPAQQTASARRGTASPTTTAAKAATTGAPAAVALRPQLLRVHPEEQAAMESLAGIIGRSPRATKRFVNSYRLLKAALTESERHRFGIVDDQLAGLAAPMFLLAIVTGVPSLAAEFVAMLPVNPAATAVGQLGALATWAAPDPTHAEGARRIQDFARTQAAARWSSLAGTELLPWISRVTQFSFEDLLPAEGFSALALPAQSEMAQA